MPTTTEREAEMAKKLLANADKVLALIDDSFIVKERGHVMRKMPTFRPEEISLGAVLGVGGFGIVNEISKLSLDPDSELEEENEPEDNGNNGSTSNGGHDNNGTDTSARQAGMQLKELQLSNVSCHNNIHYEISKARHVMERRVVRDGVCRYAIKRLHITDLSELERARGMVDLAVEAKCLSVVWHPNIIKMRGMAQGPLVDPYFFIILDRLFQTLDQRINEWHKEVRRNNGKFLGLGKKKLALHALMLDRMLVAYDLAAAFFYLHENRLVYRDIKPENIGFDIRGDVKVFDFGLCKSLSPALKARDGGYGYRLTGRAGSLPYMAPEVVRMETYDTKCDVYSFTVLLWEILCLQQAYKGMTPAEFVDKVVAKKTRLHVPNSIPPLTRLMIPEAWDNDPRKRPDMKRVAILIRGDLNDMTSDESVLHRTIHMCKRSDHSDRGVLKSGSIPGQLQHLEYSDDEE